VTQHAAPPGFSGARRAGGEPLAPAYYDRPTEDVARDLIGAILECRSPEGVTRGRIVETEAYLGPHDPACHAAAGLTDRTRTLHGPPGTAYVYFIYGMHWCVNAVTREEGHGSAVLIRALEPLGGLVLMRKRRCVQRHVELTNGPAKLCEAMAIDGRHNGLRLDRWPIRITAGEPVPDGRIDTSVRVGIKKAVDWPLRFFELSNPFVSRLPRGLSAMNESRR
jgi:DNA-3-methyladenine glycosylase